VQEREGDLDGATKELVNLANKAGGEDNITIVAFEITDEPTPASALEETRPMPAVSEPEPPEDDEDTLDESDAVPVMDTFVLSPEEAQRLQVSGSEPQSRKRRSLWPVLFLLLVAAAAAVAVVLWVLSR
jgi:hypothetical protein